MCLTKGSILKKHSDNLLKEASIQHGRGRRGVSYLKSNFTKWNGAWKQRKIDSLFTYRIKINKSSGENIKSMAGNWPPSGFHKSLGSGESISGAKWDNGYCPYVKSSAFTAIPSNTVISKWQ